MSFPSELKACSKARAAWQKQRTLSRRVAAEGIGLFTGQKVSISFLPAAINSGVVFQRVDLPHQPLLPARSEYVQGTPRCTIIGCGNDSVQTVEHLLAALRAFGIDNLLIEISGPEVPIFDGSAKRFVEMIERGPSL